MVVSSGDPEPAPPAIYRGAQLALAVWDDRIEIIRSGLLRRLRRQPARVRLCRRAIVAVVLGSWGGTLLLQTGDGRVQTLVLGASAPAAYAALQRPCRGQQEGEARDAAAC